jgi:hypothetical protein
MDGEALIRVRLQAGRYEGILTCAEGAGTGIEAVHEGRVVAAASIAPNEDRPGSWRAVIALPPEVLGEGVQVIALRSTTTGTVLDRITLMAGAPLDEDIRAEIALLRDEIEMLKRAFRRHCAETAGR